MKRELFCFSLLLPGSFGSTHIPHTAVDTPAMSHNRRTCSPHLLTARIVQTVGVFRWIFLLRLSNVRAFLFENLVRALEFSLTRF